MVVSVRYKLKFKDLQNTLIAYQKTKKPNFLNTLVCFISLFFMVVQLILMFNYFIQGRYSDLLARFIISLLFLPGSLDCFPLTAKTFDALILFVKFYLTKKTEADIYLDESSFSYQRDIVHQLKWEEIKRIIEFPSVLLIISRRYKQIYRIQIPIIYGIPKRVLTDADIDTLKQILVSQNIELERL
ncbi:MAG: YcxB family protein [Planktothrix sp.]